MKNKEPLPELGTKERIELFEKDQKEFGTKVAIDNIIYQIAADILRVIGVKRIEVDDTSKSD